MGQNLALTGMLDLHSWQVACAVDGMAEALSWEFVPTALKYWANMAGIISPRLVPMPMDPSPSDSDAFSMAMAAFICMSLFMSSKTPMRLRSSDRLLNLGRRCNGIDVKLGQAQSEMPKVIRQAFGQPFG